MLESRPIIVDLQSINKSFKKAEHQELLVLDNVNFKLHEGEIVALLGKSGSGKSTLLRIIAGLIPPTAGRVFYRNKPVKGPVYGMAMVFQNFALLPWLSVLENVEIGLEALGIPKDERRARALHAIDIIGLDGFESAYPKELSGGMRQRVGFARALVINPDVLLMDEPFSALDVLTADNLRTDLLDLWQDKKTNTNGIIFVTHNIEEAVFLADRIVIFDSDPGTVMADLKVNLEHPRNDQDVPYRKIVDEIYGLMLSLPHAKKGIAGIRFKHIDLAYRLPDVNISELSGLIEMIGSPEYEGRVGLAELAEALHLNIDDLFPLIELAEIFRFSQIVEGEVELTLAGKLFADSDILERKKMFARHLIKYIPFAKRIRWVLDERPGHRASKERFLAELEDFLSEDEAERVLKVIIEWGRYAEIFAYDDKAGMLSLENP
ncbi:MAG: nitrate/sulfonate/bicarbonate ABC transporter ATP-binding protein [Gammaproteobacteria bacterium]|nr:nitrate/sulfonate/bicarbonate ABC transporter ATP-binding protein [Gammaproteobacteria bacterium]